MFSSTRMSDSSRVQKDGLYSTMNGSASVLARSFDKPKMTSTPTKRESVFGTPPKPMLLSPRRYSLSAFATPPRLSRREPIKKSIYQNCSGPLLASTNYNVSVSTYEDSKSPGLAGRIVQYNNEAEHQKERKRLPTHQAKYGSPGLFPIVHLFKKKLPTLEQKPRKVTVRIASPDYLRRHSLEYNRKLFEEVINSDSSIGNGHGFLHSPREIVTSTRSVLDALREISRKRIHASEDYESDEDKGKRLRTELINGTETNKRLRDDSSLLDQSTSPNKPVSKKICVYDEYAASCSSSVDLSQNKSGQSQSKRKSINTLTVNPKESKQVKLINAETQTLVNEQDKSTDTEENILEEENIPNKSNTTEADPAAQRSSPVRIFDEVPLERIRKNRLAALMGSLVGKDPVFAPKPDLSDSLDEKPENLEIRKQEEINNTPQKPIKSILTTVKKSPHKPDRHVQFDIPESTAQTSSFSMTPSFSTGATTLVTVSDSAATAVSSPSVNLVSNSTASTVMTFETDESNADLNMSYKSPVATMNSDMSNKSVGLSTVPFNSSKFSANLALSKENPVSSTTAPIKGLSFNPAVSNPASTVASPPKVGGFKFDLQVTTSANTAPVATSIPSLTFPNALQKPAVHIAPSFSSAATPSGAFAFGPKSTDASVTTAASTLSAGISFDTVTTTTLLGAPITSTTVSPVLNFNKNQTKSVSSTTTSSTYGFNTVTAPMFGNGASPASPFAAQITTSTPSFTSKAPPGFTFGPPSTNPNTAQSGKQNISSTFTFGTPATSPSTTSSILSGFGASQPPSSTGFGVPVTSSVPSAFGAPTTTKSALPAFGVSIPSSNTSFGAPISSLAPTATSAPSGFGAPATTTSGLPQFGVSIPSLNTSFGAPVSSLAPAVTSAPSGFGAPATTASVLPAFGVSIPAASSSFGVPVTSLSAPATASVLGGFGVSTTSTPVPTGFGVGATATSAFSTSFSSSASSLFEKKPLATAGSNFGNTSTTPSPFGKTTMPAFGLNSTQPPFGTSTIGGTAVTSPSFGTTNNASPTFGIKPGGFAAQPSNTTNIFGGTTVTQAFGVPNTNAGFSTPAAPFGTATTTSGASFGTSPASVFSFGAKTTANATFAPGSGFGASTTAASTGFGTTTAPSFSGPPSSNTFGGSNIPNFGQPSTTLPNGFGTANTPGFAGTNGGFGSNNVTLPFGNSTAFGASANNAPAFGSPTPSAGFGKTTNTSGFGTNITSSTFGKPQTAAPNTFNTVTNAFGTPSTQNPATTQPAAFSFGAAPAPTPGVFSFAGKPTADPPKPSFNFTGGNAEVPAFGSNNNAQSFARTATPSFGASANPSFGTAAAPSFGSSGMPAFGIPQQPAATGSFSIGAGPPSSGRPRTQLRAKRRT